MAPATAPGAAQVSAGRAAGGKRESRAGGAAPTCPDRARGRRGAGHPRPRRGGAAPGAEPLPSGRPTLQEAAGLVKKKKPRGPGAAAGILAVPAETFPAK